MLCYSCCVHVTLSLSRGRGPWSHGQVTWLKELYGGRRAHCLMLTEADDRLGLKWCFLRCMLSETIERRHPFRVFLFFANRIQHCWLHRSVKVALCHADVTMSFIQTCMTMMKGV